MFKIISKDENENKKSRNYFDEPLQCPRMCESKKNKKERDKKREIKKDNVENSRYEKDK